MKMEDFDENEEVVEQTPNTVRMPSKPAIGAGSNEHLIKEMQKLRAQMGEVDNDNYWVIDGLPSKGRLYAEGSQIQGRPLKVIEVKKLSSITDDNADFVVNDIIKRATKGIDVNDLLIADKLFIILWLRANTYRDDGYVVDFRCMKCNNDSEYHFDINNIEVVHLSDDYDSDGIITLNGCGDKVRIKFLTVKDELVMARFKEINMKILGDIDDDILEHACMIEEINGEKPTLLKKYNWLINFKNPGDYAQIVTHIEEISFGVKPYIVVNCGRCGGDTPVGVTFHTNFVFPKYKSQ